jgi:hypothetical protein
VAAYTVAGALRELRQWALKANRISISASLSFERSAQGVRLASYGSEGLLDLTNPPAVP